MLSSEKRLNHCLSTIHIWIRCNCTSVKNQLSRFMPCNRTFLECSRRPYHRSRYKYMSIRNNTKRVSEIRIRHIYCKYKCYMDIGFVVLCAGLISTIKRFHVAKRIRFHRKCTECIDRNLSRHTMLS